MAIDEGFTDEYVVGHTPPPSPFKPSQSWMTELNDAQRQELAYQLLMTLPRSHLAELHRNLAPKLKVDIVASLPPEISISILSHLSYTDLLTCVLVSKKWQTLANDQELWRRQCNLRGWEWKPPRTGIIATQQSGHRKDLDVDEGVGEEETEYVDLPVAGPSNAQRTRSHDSGFVSMLSDTSTSLTIPGLPRSSSVQQIGLALSRLDKPSTLLHSHRILPIVSTLPAGTAPNYKLLHQTHMLLNSRMRNSSFRMTVLPLREPSPDLLFHSLPQGHTSTIYCLALYTHPLTGQQHLLTGSRDCTILEWDLCTRRPVRCFKGAHFGSVLNLAVSGEWMVTGGSDGQVVVWNLITGAVHKARRDTEDSVLCVRASSKTIVACGKDRHLRIYSLPDLKLVHILVSHRAAVNALSLSPDGLFVISASGDRSVRIWDTVTGKIVASLEGWHSRGIASIDFHPPYIVSGSSDKHIRLPENLPNSLTSSLEFETPVTPSHPPLPLVSSSQLCQSCNGLGTVAKPRAGHKDLVRTVAMNRDFVVSGSYDETIKVWDRRTGALLGDLTGGHTGRVFGVVFDSTKIISCGEDQVKNMYLGLEFRTGHEFHKALVMLIMYFPIPSHSHVTIRYVPESSHMFGFGAGDIDLSSSSFRHDRLAPSSAMRVNQPSNQIKLTNVSIVRLKKGGKRFEIACYKNKVQEWRNGVETDLDEVLQINNVFTNVSKAFGKTDVSEIVKEILKKGELQVGDKERAHESSQLWKEIATQVAEKCVDPTTQKPYPVGIIEKAMTEAGFSVKTGKNAKAQVSSRMYQALASQFDSSYQRARMRVRITMPSKDGKRLKDQVVQGADKVEDEDWGEEWQITMLIDPGQFRVLTELVQSDKELKGSGRIETLSFSAST
ncbi:shwachman-bodian-diamond syndrome protein [Rhizoctonia solani]|uniref:Shwachman-bodian-diamond syndrome protein n=1 Tax=Rhizoctonia solani TaxID=456999 RepID=A0A8H8NVM9_9AGAM|nr:shwachman-bodian-diamond syndrome protein [Rhizoctonia solani]QRW18977.1 shwachman-bodian-diamond syndrome protein [Rhizoctonia solani]